MVPLFCYKNVNKILVVCQIFLFVFYNFSDLNRHDFHHSRQVVLWSPALAAVSMRVSGQLSAEGGREGRREGGREGGREKRKFDRFSEDVYGTFTVL